MVETICKVFYCHSVDTDTKALMVFDSNLDDKDVIQKIAEYLEKEEMDANDEDCILQTKEECLEEATNIVNGGLLDLYWDRYFIREVDFFKNV